MNERHSTGREISHIYNGFKQRNTKMATQVAI
jgi:hypothetical protein